MTTETASSTSDNFIKIENASNLKGEDRAKYDDFKKKYEETFNFEPDYVIFSPGRVNIIGEHIDYHKFSVLPMALKQSILMGISINNHKQQNEAHKIRLMNTSDQADRDSWSGEHSLKYAMKLNQEIDLWYNYFLCGYQGILANELMGLECNELLVSRYANDLDKNEELDGELKKLPSLDILVHSDLPAASGLSSSSALVCASALATIIMLYQGRKREDLHSIDRLQLANNCSLFEHLIGTQGGGMDQAIIMTAQRNFAKFVQFHPDFKCDNVRLPDEIIWLVSHSGVQYPKATTSGFNTRVLETKIGASLIAQYFSRENNSCCPSGLTIGELKDTIFNDWTLAEIVNYLRDHVFNQSDGKYTIEEICGKLKLSRKEFMDKFKISEEFLNDLSNQKLVIKDRCEHVLEEADRVIRFKSICDTTTNTVLLGQLMSQSHASLRDKFDCSHPALDRLVSAALEAGALGSRLTGAGWGGCVITMVEESKSETVLERLKELSSFTFMTKPESGCRIIATN